MGLKTLTIQHMPSENLAERLGTDANKSASPTLLRESIDFRDAGSANKFVKVDLDSKVVNSDSDETSEHIKGEFYGTDFNFLFSSEM